jgi:hypothetical protein
MMVPYCLDTVQPSNPAPSNPTTEALGQLNRLLEGTQEVWMQLATGENCMARAAVSEAVRHLRLARLWLHGQLIGLESGGQRV